MTATILSLSSLALTHFRNYASARLQLATKPVILTGPNGAGKTNILEAVSLLAPGRGIRRAKLEAIDRHGDEQPWTIAAQVQGMQGEVQIGTGRDSEYQGPSQKRIVKIDGKQASSHEQLAKHVAILWLTPQMEQIFHESASDGRRFFDRLVYSFDADHAGRINRYETAMRERNRLLAEERADPTWLDAVEAKMAENAAAVAAARLAAEAHINHAVASSPLSFPKASISIDGNMEKMMRLGIPASEAELSLQQELARNRAGDAAAGRANAGTHRSEMQVLHLEKRLPAELCSTGEQKAMLLSIILAQVRAGGLWHGVVPLVLLDEVVSHLDPNRRLELFEEICETQAQVWMTGTDASLFEGCIGKAQFFEVQNGQVYKGE